MASQYIKFIIYIWINSYILFIIADENTTDIVHLSSSNRQEHYETINDCEGGNESRDSTSKLSNADVYEDAVALTALNKCTDNIEIQHLLKVAPEFNPGAGDVSPICKKHSLIYQQELKKLNLWALKMYDATAKIPSGLLSGNVNQFGDFDECLSVEGSDEIRGKYCLAYLQFDVDESRSDLKILHKLIYSHYLFKNNYTDVGHIIPRFGTIHWAVCVPQMCTTGDVEAALNNTIEKYIEGTGINFSLRVNDEMCQVKNVSSIPLNTIIVSWLFIGIIIFSIVATICDHHHIHVHEIIRAFSMQRNYRKLVSLNQSHGDIPSLHGIRALHTFLLLIAHKNLALYYIPYMNRTQMSETYDNSWTVFGRAAAIYTDTFLMMSGLLTSYSMVNQLQNSGKINVIKEYISRFFRLAPTLIAIILLATYIIPEIGSGPMWNLMITRNTETCKQRWWQNLLFIHNLCGFEHICLSFTHHVGIDIQLFLLSPIMIQSLYKWPKYGSIALGTLAIMSTGLRFFVGYFKQLNSNVYYGISTQQLLNSTNFSYCLSTHRMTVYIIGILLGYLLMIYPKKYKINATIFKLGWILSILAGFATFAGPSFMATMDYIDKPIYGAINNAFAPIGICIIFAWIIFVSHTESTKGWISRIFEWKGFIICTRLSYAIYLIQFPIFFYNTASIRTQIYFNAVGLIVNLSEWIVIIISAVILTLFIEMPFVNIKNYLFKKIYNEIPVEKIEKTM